MTTKAGGLSRLVVAIRQIDRRQGKTRGAVLARKAWVPVNGAWLVDNCSRGGCAGCVFAGVPREKLR